MIKIKINTSLNRSTKRERKKILDNEPLKKNQPMVISA